jgi:hypothetical protein
LTVAATEAWGRIRLSVLPERCDVDSALGFEPALADGCNVAEQPGMTYIDTYPF